MSASRQRVCAVNDFTGGVQDVTMIVAGLPVVLISGPSEVPERGLARSPI
jgi:hypothetical protein